MSDKVQAYTSERAEAAESEEQTEEESVDELQCPECSGSLATDTEHGETVCQDCGLVVDEDSIDRGPECVRSTPARKTRSPVSAPLRRT